MNLDRPPRATLPARTHASSPVAHATTHRAAKTLILAGLLATSGCAIQLGDSWDGSVPPGVTTALAAADTGQESQRVVLEDAAQDTRDVTLEEYQTAAAATVACLKTSGFSATLTWVEAGPSQVASITAVVAPRNQPRYDKAFARCFGANTNLIEFAYFQRTEVENARESLNERFGSAMLACARAKGLDVADGETADAIAVADAHANGSGPADQLCAVVTGLQAAVDGAS